MELQRKRSQSRLGWAVLGGVGIIAVLALVLARLGYVPRPFGAASSVSNATPVLLITVDTLRADHVGCYGYSKVETPAMDFLAAQGVRFDDALAQVPLTLPSHTVILSGTYPMWNGVRDFSKPLLRKDTKFLAEAFGRHGYATAAFVSSFVLNSSWGLNRGFETYDAESLESKSLSGFNQGLRRRGGETIDHLLAWFRAHDPQGKGAKPFFVWLHLYDIHSPYDPPEPFHTQYASHLYDGGIAYTDSQLGRLFDYLRQIGFYDRTLIVLLSDHGESLGEHGEIDHGYFIYRSTIRVPLIIKPVRSATGGDEARVVDAPVGTVDVAPTVLELAHLQDPPLNRQFQGSSLASLVLGKSTTSERPVYAESYDPRDAYNWSPLYSVSTNRFQYIQAPRPELYDLTQDEAETHNVYAQHSAETATLRDQLQVIRRRYTDTASSNAAQTLSADAVEKLKSLGYVAYSAPVTTANDNDLPDPKDKLPTYLAYTRAVLLWTNGEYEKSEALLKPLLGKEPGLAVVPLQLGLNAQKLERWADAERDFQASLKIDPTLEMAITSMAEVTNSEGKFDESRKWLELEISQHPQDYNAHYDLGQLARARHDLEEARRDFAKAVELEPGHAPSQAALGMVLFEMERYGEAVKPLEAAASLGTNDPVLFNALATAYLNKNQRQKAIAAAQKGLAARGDSAAARLNHALEDLVAGNHQNAIDEFHSICNDDPADCLQYEKFFQ